MKKIKNLFLIYCLLFLFLTLFRSLQLNLAIDSLTGFTKVPLMDIILYGILILFLLFILFYIYYDKKSKNIINNLPFVSKYTKYIFLLYAVLVLLTYTFNINELLSEYKYLEQNVSIILIFTFKIITYVFGLLTGIILLVEIFKVFYKKDNYKINVFSCFITIIHSILSLLTFFIKERTLVTISQNLLTLFFWIFAVIFIFAFCKYLCSSNIGKPIEEMLISGMMTSILGTITIVSPFFAKNQTYYSIIDSERLITIPIFLLSTSMIIVTLKAVFNKENEF